MTLMFKIIGVILMFSPLAGLCAGPTGDSYIKVGGSNDYDSFVSSKFLSVGYQHPLTYSFDYQLETGIITDTNRPNNGSSVFAGPSIGVSLNNPQYYAKAFFGPAYVSHTDARLSSSYEFNTDAELGLKDDRGVAIGLGFKHLSNGGIVGPNLGRDYLFIKLQF